MTTTALGLAVTWTRPVMLAECDPGHRSLLPGFLAERLRHPPGPGLLGLAMEAHHGTTISPRALDRYLISLDGDHGDPGAVRLLHGIRDPRHAAQLSAVWPALASLFTDIETDVIADMGCVGGSDTPMPLLTRAHLVVMVVRPTLRQIDAAQPRLEALQQSLGRRPVLCLIGDRPYPRAAIQSALFNLPVLSELPHAAEARVLSDGAPPRRTFRTSVLVRALTGLGARMRHITDQAPPANSGRGPRQVLAGSQVGGESFGGRR